MKTQLVSLGIICLLIFGCKSQSSTTNQTTEATSPEKPKMHPDHPNIPLAEKGITVVNPTGWEQSQMDFHIDYCMQTLSKVENTDPLVFCECFLSKIQYYYKPIFVKEAYTDQTKWNSECLSQAQQ